MARFGKRLRSLIEKARGLPRNVLKITLLGRQAREFADVFGSHAVRIARVHSDIRKDDDLVFCLSHDQIVPQRFLVRPRIGVFVVHSTDLPKGRGWAPLNWSILKGLHKVTVTLFHAQPRVDAGPWYFKTVFPIHPLDTITDLRRKDSAAVRKLLGRFMRALDRGSLSAQPQRGTPEYWPRRTPADSELDAGRPLTELWNQMRACDNADYPAFFRLHGRRIFLRYDVEPARASRRNSRRK